MELSRTIPSRREIVIFYAIKKDFSIFSEAWRNVRKNMRNPLDKCDWCNTPFKDGDLIALGFCKTSKNKVLCQQCAVLAEAQPPGKEESRE